MKPDRLFHRRNIRCDHHLLGESIMRTSLVIVSLVAGVSAIAGLGTSAFADKGTYSAWGHDFTYEPFQSKPVDITVATDKKTGHTMNLVKLKNGHMMVLIPADRYMALMTTPSDDMME
jgi:hypothetical protein